MADRFRQRADACFAAVFQVSVGAPASPEDRADAARRARASKELHRELQSCVTGQGYGGQAMLAAATVRRWLSLPTCEAFARAAFRSRQCFALQGVLDAVGFPRRRPAARSARIESTLAAPSCATPDPPDGQGRYAAAHILIFFAGATRAPAHITRTQAQARALAARISRLARKPGADFAALARQHSEGPTRSRGGRLGAFLPSRMVPPFSNAVKRLCIGEISGPVRTRFGYHVILRQRP